MIDEFARESGVVRKDVAVALGQVAARAAARNDWDLDVATFAPCGRIVSANGSLVVIVSAHADAINFLVGRDARLWSFDDEDQARRLADSVAGLEALLYGRFTEDGMLRVELADGKVITLD